METHFAGSQRRRRRLAAESDTGPSDGTETTTSDWVPLDSPLLAGKAGRNAPARAIAPWQRSGPFPLLPRALWKLFAIASLSLLLGAGLLATGASLTSVQLESLPGTARLLSRESGTLYRAFPALLLFFAGQSAVIVWWYRSRSVRDFDGCYRRWIKVAAACFVMSFSIVTDAHLAWGEGCAACCSRTFWQSAVLWWLAPAGLLGLCGWLPVYREMQGCRLSIGFFLAATAMYLVAAALRLQLLVLPTEELSWLILASVAWLGHLLLSFSLALHARYVMYFTAEPIEPRPRERRRDQGHFGWANPSRWFRRSAAAGEGTETDESGKKDKDRRRTSRTKANAKTRIPKSTAKTEDSNSAETDSDDSDVDQGEEIESSQSNSRVAVTAPPVTSQVNPKSGGRGPQILPPAAKPAAPPAFNGGSSRSGTISPVELPDRPVEQERRPQDVTRNDRAEDFAEDDEDAGTDEGNDNQNPDLRGLSKKQRRKLQREMRDRELQARRR